MKTTRFKDILLGVEQSLLTIGIKGFSDNAIAKKVSDMLSEVFRDFPWTIRFTDWTDRARHISATSTARMNSTLGKVRMYSINLSSINNRPGRPMYWGCMVRVKARPYR